MSIVGKLTANDCELIESYIETFGGPDGCSTTLRAPLEHILRFWGVNKEDLFHLFGDELILAKSINVAKSAYELEDDIERNVLNYGGPGRTFFDAFWHWKSDAKIDTQFYWELSSLTNSSSLASNIYSGNTFEIGTDSNHPIVVNAGCKISKILGKIAKTFNLPGYEEFRIAHSQCLNQKYLRGELCLSIHPLDYMTMSDNNCDWDSCMSWQQPGDYRIGTVEMMNSPCIVVAYLRSSTDMNMPNGGTWNSKKWRQLFIVTPEMISGIRQYPYDNNELCGTALKWLRSLAQDNAHWGPYTDNAVKISNYDDNIVAEISEDPIKIHIHTRYMYNDFGRGHLSFLSKYHKYFLL